MPSSQKPQPGAAATSRATTTSKTVRTTFRGAGHRLAPLIWISPAAALVAVVVLWPVVVMIRTAFQHFTPDGVLLGAGGWRNFADLFGEPDLAAVLARTVVWVLAVVSITLVLSVALAQLFNTRFPGRRLARCALIAPWAASVVMTSLIFRWSLDPNSGVVNVFLHDIGLVHTLGSSEADWLGRPTAALVWMMVVAIFVSVPFTTYTLIAGLQTIPAEVHEAARMDGASPWRRFRSITLPMIRPAVLVALLINVINVFNSFPIIWEMTRGGPGYQTATTTVFMYQIKQSYIGESAALSVLNFLLVVVVVLVFLKVTKWKDQIH